jgi:hypothetical protein
MERAEVSRLRKGSSGIAKSRSLLSTGLGNSIAAAEMVVWALERPNRHNHASINTGRELLDNI